MRPPGLSPGAGSDQGAGGPMAIFELLDYIVNEVRFILNFHAKTFEKFGCKLENFDTFWSFFSQLRGGPRRGGEVYLLTSSLVG